MKREQGFTMLELVITLIIIAILAGIAIPGFSRWLPNYRLKGAARDLYSNLQLAKMTAVKDRGACGVLFDIANNRYRVVASGDDRIFGNGDDRTLSTVNLTEYGGREITYGHGNATQTATTPPGADFDNNVTFDEDGVLFDSRGMILRPSGTTSTGGHVYLQNRNGTTYAIGVLTAGVVVMRRWTGTAWQQ